MKGLVVTCYRISRLTWWIRLSCQHRDPFHLQCPFLPRFGPWRFTSCTASSCLMICLSFSWPWIGGRMGSGGLWTGRHMVAPLNMMLAFVFGVLQRGELAFLILWSFPYSSVCISFMHLNCLTRLFRWALAVLCGMLVVELVQSQLKLARTVLAEFRSDMGKHDKSLPEWPSTATGPCITWVYCCPSVWWVASLGSLITICPSSPRHRCSTWASSPSIVWMLGTERIRFIRFGQGRKATGCHKWLQGLS